MSDEQIFCLCCENPTDPDIPGRSAIEETLRQAKARECGEVAELRADLASARSANKSMYERINRLEREAEAQAMRHRETIQTLRMELGRVMPDE